MAGEDGVVQTFDEDLKYNVVEIRTLLETNLETARGLKRKLITASAIIESDL